MNPLCAKRALEFIKDAGGGAPAGSGGPVAGGAPPLGAEGSAPSDPDIVVVRTGQIIAGWRVTSVIGQVLWDRGEAEIRIADCGRLSLVQADPDSDPAPRVSLYGPRTISIDEVIEFHRNPDGRTPQIDHHKRPFNISTPTVVA